MRQLLLSSMSIAALMTADDAYAGFKYPSGMTADTPITSLSQIAALQAAVVSQGKADGILTGSYYQNNPTGPPIAIAGQKGAYGIDTMQYTYSSNQVQVDPTNLSGTLTAATVAAVLSHEDIHPMQATLTNDSLTEDEQASLDEQGGGQGRCCNHGG